MNEIKRNQQEIESIEKFLERLEGYGCGYHKQLVKQMKNRMKKLVYEINKDLKWFLKYNSTEGMHTMTMCECGKKSCRRYKCNECIEKELDAVQGKSE